MPVGMQRDPEPPQGTGDRLGKCPASPGLGTLGSHQDKGWAPTLWCGYRVGCLGPSAPPCHPLPSPGARPSLPDLLQTHWGQGRIVQLHSGRRGLGGGGGRHNQLWACGTTASTALAPLRPYSLGNPWGLDAREALGFPDTQPALRSHLTPHLGQEAPREGATGGQTRTPPQTPLGLVQDPPAPVKAAPGHPHIHLMGCPGVPLGPPSAGPGQTP